MTVQSPRRYPLTVGGRVKHMDGREGVVKALNEIYAHVIWDDNSGGQYLHGYLQALPGERTAA